MATRVTMDSSDDDLETALAAGRAMLKALRKFRDWSDQGAENDDQLDRAMGACRAAIEHGEKAGLA